MPFIAGKTPAAPAAPSALEGVSVLDLSCGVAGQFAGRVLAEHGADVLLIEPLEGSPMRTPKRTEDRHLFWHLNTGKRSLSLDTRTARGEAQLERLAARADVILADRHADLARWAGVHPRLVTCEVRDFAPTGPYKDWTGSEMIHQEHSGLMYSTGRADSAPLYGFGHRAYYAAGAAAVTAIVGALLVRMRTGRGQALWVAVHETAIGMSQNAVAQYSYNGSGMRRGPYPGACDMFECNDGWVSMYCRGDRWAVFCASLGHAEVPSDPRFSSIDQVVRNWAAVYGILAPTVRELAVADFIGRVERSRGIASRVNTAADVLACEHLRMRGYFEKVADAQGRERTVLGPIFRMSATPRQVLRGAPPVGVAGETGTGARHG